MSVLSELDRTAVASAIERARAPRTQLTRTQALAPHKPRAKREKREPLLFVGLCSFCGAPALFHQNACEGHSDLPALDSRTSAVVTCSTFGAGTSPKGVPGHPLSEGRPAPIPVNATSTAVARTTFPGSASDGSKEDRT